MKVNYFVVLIGIVFMGCNTNIVSYKPESRNVSVDVDSFIIKTNIALKVDKSNLKNNLQYYWYSSGQLGVNYGGYNGYLLNGPYKKINLKGNLIEQGNFSSGLKDGIWKYWYRNGELKRIEKWNNGVISSKVLDYSKEGRVLNPNNTTSNFENQLQTDSTSVKTPWYKRLFKKDKRSLN
ncbi:MAG: toxin-antitoxin system YwqK family antitoxin [Tenuifilaceae bacterium]